MMEWLWDHAEEVAFLTFEAILSVAIGDALWGVACAGWVCA